MQEAMMDKKAYAKYDRFFMAFGSIMNGSQHIITDESIEAVVKTAAKLAWDITSEVVDRAYKITEENATNEPDKSLRQSRAL